MTEIDEDVLQALDEHPKQAMGLVELMAAAGYAKGTVRASLARLRAAGLICRPPGTKRKGVSLSHVGFQRMHKADRGATRRRE